MSWTSDRKEQRMAAIEGKPLSDRTYNLTLGFVVLYGLIANVLSCYFIGDKLNNINPVAFLIGYFALAITGILMSSFSKNPFISFIGYNLVVLPVGVVVSMVVSTYVKNGNANLVFQAIVYTALITATMVILSIIYPNFFARLGGLLFGCLIGLIIAEIVAIFIFPGLQNIFAWVGAILFTLYIGYDYWKAQQYPKTLDNAVDSALDIYLDIINLFLKILQILGSSKSNKSDD